jgi:hypothetical protein
MGTKMIDEFYAEANAAFYNWEIKHPEKNLSDDDRLIWCHGYVARLIENELKEISCKN